MAQFCMRCGSKLAMDIEDRRFAKEMIEESLYQDYVFNTAVSDGVIECADGCTVELDGVCPHGHKSPLLVLGLF